MEIKSFLCTPSVEKFTNADANQLRTLKSTPLIGKGSMVISLGENMDTFHGQDGEICYVRTRSISIYFL